MRLTSRSRTLPLCVALSAAVLATGATLVGRSEHFARRATDHLRASSLLDDLAGGSVDCLHQIGIEEGETWEAAADRLYAARGERAFLAYKASVYHWRLYNKYRRASERPWRMVSADPPPPRMAYRRFPPDARGEPGDWGSPLVDPQ